MKFLKALSTTLLLLITFFLISSQWLLEETNNSKNVIPLKIVYGLPLVNVNIGDQLVELVLDLGAAYSSLSKELIEQLELPSLNKEVHMINIYGKTQNQPAFYTTNSLIGNYMIPFLVLTESDDFNPEFEPDTPLELLNGKIGRKAFLNKVLYIDRKNEFSIVKEGLENHRPNLNKLHSGKWIETDFKLDKNLGICLELFINSEDKNKTFLLDTGSNVSLIHKKSTQKRSIDLKSPPNELLLKLDPQISLGKFSLYSFDLTDFGFDGILGFDFFEIYRVCVDFCNQKVYLQAYEG